MIRFENVSKTFVLGGIRKNVARNISMLIPTGACVGLLGRNGAGKSTLMKMISGTLAPSEGRIFHSGTVSWPVGFAGSFHPELSGAQNTRFIARVYGCDTEELLEFVDGFAELGSHFYLPFRTYSSGMRSRLAFGVSMGVRFDTYLIDEVTSVGDAAFQTRSRNMLKARTQQSGAIVVSHGMGMIRQLCSAGAVLENGTLTYFDNIEEAIEVHEANMALKSLCRTNQERVGLPRRLR
ncbi:ABC transporter ATP-binding protein [Planktotalea arctica]|uniref:ABC transporter ATP-binding protein n=1 Tax=Planktotalea arctica TaxID=1481893 RepID=UPI00321B2F85